MVKEWKDAGIEVKRLCEVVTPANDIIKPGDYPDELFTLLKVSYEGKCEVESRKKGLRIGADLMHHVVEGQVVFSTIRATDGAVGIVPPDLEGRILVSKSSYTVFDCGSPEDAAYLWSVLRSHEIRADMQSLSPGSGRYTTYWPDVGELWIPWLSDRQRRKVGEQLIQLWASERQIEILQRQNMSHLDQLGLESEQSRRRWKVSKAPQ